MSGTREAPLLQITVSQADFSQLPEGLRRASRFPVTAVLFTQGINEEQSEANKGADAEIQYDINAHFGGACSAYLNRYRAFLLQYLWDKSKAVDEEGQSM